MTERSTHELAADDPDGYINALTGENDALVARVADLEERLNTEHARGYREGVQNEKQAAEARVAALTQERDVLNDKAVTLEECWLEEEARAEAAEAALANTRHALADGVRIASQYLDTGRGDLDGWIDSARALAAGDNTTEPA